jgi:hypothetical protein
MRSFMDDDTEIDKNKLHKLCSMRETDETGIQIYAAVTS